MTQQQIAIFAGALRAVLAGALGWFVTAGYVSSAMLNDTLLFFGTVGICAWSFLAKQGDAKQWYPALMGPARNFAVTALTYAVGRGWVRQEDVAPMIAGAGVLFAALWSAESKFLTHRGMRNILIFCIAGLPALGLMGCGIVNIDTTDAQTAVYTSGQTMANLLPFADAWPGALPQPFCKAVGVANIAFQNAETTVRDPNFKDGQDTQKILVALQNAVIALGEAWAEVALTAPKPPSRSAPLISLTGDPGDSDWDALNAQLAQETSTLKCS